MNKTKTESLLIYSSEDYIFDKLNKYSLKTSNNDSVINYEYIFEENNDKNLYIKHYFNTSSIKFFINEFIKIEDSAFTIDSISKNPFYYYSNVDKSASHFTDPLIFNKDYGLLVLGNSYGGPNLIFIKEEKDSIHIQEIGNKLKEFHRN